MPQNQYELIMACNDLYYVVYEMNGRVRVFLFDNVNRGIGRSDIMQIMDIGEQYNRVVAAIRCLECNTNSIVVCNVLYWANIMRWLVENYCLFVKRQYKRRLLFEEPVIVKLPPCISLILLWRQITRSHYIRHFCDLLIQGF